MRVSLIEYGFLSSKQYIILRMSYGPQLHPTSQERISQLSDDLSLQHVNVGHSIALTIQSISKNTNQHIGKPSLHCITLANWQYNRIQHINQERKSFTLQFNPGNTIHFKNTNQYRNIILYPRADTRRAFPVR